MGSEMCIRDRDKELQGRANVEFAILANNQKKINNCQISPPFNEPLLSELGWLGDGPEVQRILSGEYPYNPALDKYTNMLIQALQVPESIQASTQISKNIPPADWSAAWRKQKGKTSSSKSGIHFGHYKASCLDEAMCALDAMMADIPYSTGYVPNRWKLSVDVMIPIKVIPIAIAMLVQ